jgi:uncharacterized protein (TIGR03083 family)
MSADSHVDGCLIAIRDLSETLSAEIATLSLEAWNGPTNCPPWRVRDLASHIVSSGQGFVGSIRRGLAGSVEAPQRHGAEDAPEPTSVARSLDALTDEFESLYRGLSAAQLDTICYHRRGNRSIRWYAAHRLAEVAFHGWDLRTSLGRNPTFDDTVAALILPTLLESNAPRTYAAGLSQQRGGGERYTLIVRDEPMSRWLVTINPDRLEVTPGGGDADLSITASASTLALLVYGRAELASIPKVEGDPALIARFAKVFPRP